MVQIKNIRSRLQKIKETLQIEKGTLLRTLAVKYSENRNLPYFRCYVITIKWWILIQRSSRMGISIGWTCPPTMG